ncbi:ubiquitin carboxyl-terminal hydrolase 35 [Orussus abietinus]|uniref:ubiquitin carboxyl-terminal hydrolase 35 n=1 Tax=Orussus abietinus TaxID=222816 RepID=UPI00062679A3|nr:ubiquitin carboxyl-terminal hydrolase 35 [Orussus abietinus]
MEAESIVRRLTKALSTILSGKAEEVSEGWDELNEIDQVLRETIVSTNLEDIFWDTLNFGVQNVQEAPRLLTWFAKYLTERSEPCSSFLTFLESVYINDIAILADVLQMIQEHPIYLKPNANYINLGKLIILRLADFPMPCEHTKISQFMGHTRKIQSFLEMICKQTRNVDAAIFSFLDTLYDIISDTNKKREPGPGLAVVLELVHVSVIQHAVDWILSELHNEEQLVESLKVLCSWVPKWPQGNYLRVWIMALIRGLEAEHKYSVLAEATDATAVTMFSSLMLPCVRKNVSIVFHILSRQSTPTLFHKIIKKVPKVLPHLMKDNSEQSKQCVQDIVDVTKALTLRFPGYPIYEGLLNSFPVVPNMHVVHDIFHGPIWAEETEELESQINRRDNSGKVGLVNLGNTCYMNSILQALVMTKQFCHEVLTYKYSHKFNDQSLFRKLQDLFALLQYSKRVSLSPNDILLASRPVYFMPGEQQDSSEFLCHLLDVLYEQEKSITAQCGNGNAATSTKTKEEEQAMDANESMGESGGMIKRWTTEEDLTGDTILQRKTQSLADFTQGEDLGQTQQLSDSHSDSTDSGIQSVGGEEVSTQTFLVHRVFGGESKITYQCAQCDNSSHNTDRFRDLQLCFPEEIPETQEVSVQDLINYYLTPEKLTGENQYHCDKCMKLCDAQRIIKVLRAPSHLILTLKHFHYDSESRLRAKLRHKIMYNETIQLPVSTLSNSVTETYQLYAAVVHAGYSMDYGHYFTYSRDSKQNWYKFSDSYVTQTTLEDLKRLEPPDTPYVLFYERTTNSEVVYEDDRPELTSLSKHLQELIAIDTTAYTEELRHQAEKKRRKISKIIRKRRDNSDDDNPPPSSCRGPVDILTNHILF